MSSAAGNDVAPFFGFMGAAAALVFSCKGKGGWKLKCHGCKGLQGREKPSFFSHAPSHCPLPHRHGGIIWHSKVGSGHCVHGCDASRTGDEVYRARGYGRCPGYLRPHYCSHHLHGG